MKSTGGYHFIPTRIDDYNPKQTKKSKQKITTIGKNVEKLEFLNIDVRNVKWCNCCGEVWRFLKNFYHITTKLYS